MLKKLLAPGDMAPGQLMRPVGAVERLWLPLARWPLTRANRQVVPLSVTRERIRDASGIPGYPDV